MSESAIPSENRRPRARRPRNETRGARRQINTAPLAEYLASLDLAVQPTIHVNGHGFPMALVTVDFGQPLKPIKLTAEQNQEFTDRLRKLARDVLGRDGVRVSHDLSGGLVYYVSAAYADS